MKGARIEGALLGALICGLVLVVCATWVFALYYVPSIDDAHSSIVYAETASPFLATLRSFRWFAESGVMTLTILAIATMWLRRSYRAGDRIEMRWYLLLALVPIAGLYSFTGQLLLMDQDAYHGTVVRMGIVESVPLIGPWIRDMLFGSARVDGTTLTRFYALHAIVLPVIMLGLLFALYRRRPRDPAVIAGAIVASALLVALAALFPRPISIAARPETPLADVRPEWFFLPLSMALRLGSVAGTCIHIGAGVAAIALIVWPFIAPKLKGNFDRVAMCGALAIHLSLTAWGFGQDAKKGVGYFRTPDLEAVMTEMGKVNERLGYEGQLGASERAAEAAADLLMLLREVEQLADHGDVKDRKRWLEWCAESRERVIEFWSKPRDADATLHSLRTLCDDCHKLQETDENVWPILPHPPDRYPLSEDAFANLAPTSDIPAKLKNLMKHMHQAYDELNAAGPGSAQALLDLEAYTKALAPYFESEGMADVGKREVWDQTIRDLMDACRMIRQAEAAPQVYEGLQTAHIACGACHTEFGVDDDAAELAPPRK